MNAKDQQAPRRLMLKESPQEAFAELGIGPVGVAAAAAMRDRAGGVRYRVPAFAGIFPPFYRRPVARIADVLETLILP